MSWMDSWSRPSKSQATPPPYYLTNPGTKYCHTCGRVISDRKVHRPDPTPAKYCSAKCRSLKPNAKDRRIERAFVALLNGEKSFEDEEIPETVQALRIKPKIKGEKRFIVPCSAAEILCFGSRQDPSKIYGRKKNRASRALDASNGNGQEGEWKSVDMESDEEVYQAKGGSEFITTAFAGKVRPLQTQTEVNGSVGGEKGWAERAPESEEAASRRYEGQKIADEKEQVKRAARRMCVFGIAVGDAAEKSKKGAEGEESKLKLCEAVMTSNVVEPSFAKGDWAIRWRE